jgi:hypothetical protein
MTPLFLDYGLNATCRAGAFIVTSCDSISM